MEKRVTKDLAEWFKREESKSCHQNRSKFSKQIKLITRTKSNMKEMPNQPEFLRINHLICNKLPNRV
jgi:hypothetical protein